MVRPREERAAAKIGTHLRNILRTKVIMVVFDAKDPIRRKHVFDTTTTDCPATQA